MSYGKEKSFHKSLTMVKKLPHLTVIDVKKRIQYWMLIEIHP